VLILSGSSKKTDGDEVAPGLCGRVPVAVAIAIAAKPRVAFALHTSRRTLVMWVVARRNEAQVAGGRRLALDDIELK
jgi:hypothetical protein